MVENLCNVLLRSGDTAVSGGADPGVKVSARAKENLKLSVYYSKNQEGVSRAFNVRYIKLVNISKLIKHREIERNHTDLELTPNIKSKDWPKTMEYVEDYL